MKKNIIDFNFRFPSKGLNTVTPERNLNVHYSPNLSDCDIFYRYGGITRRPARTKSVTTSTISGDPTNAIIWKPSTTELRLAQYSADIFKQSGDVWTGMLTLSGTQRAYFSPASLYDNNSFTQYLILGNRGTQYIKKYDGSAITDLKRSSYKPADLSFADGKGLAPDCGYHSTLTDKDLYIVFACSFMVDGVESIVSNRICVKYNNAASGGAPAGGAYSNSHPLAITVPTATSGGVYYANCSGNVIDPNVNEIRLYRTAICDSSDAAMAAELVLISNVAVGNGATTARGAYISAPDYNKPDGELFGMPRYNPDTVYNAPPEYQDFAIYWRGKLFCLKDGVLSWSLPLKPQYFQSAGNKISIFSTQVETITAVRNYKDRLYFFSETGIYCLTNDQPEYMSMVKLPNAIGCVSPNSICEGYGDLWFYAFDGIYRFDGFSTTPLPTTVHKFTTDMLDSRKKNVAMVIHADELWMSYSYNGGSRNTRTLVYNFKYQDWTQYLFGVGMFLESKGVSGTDGTLFGVDEWLWTEKMYTGGDARSMTYYLPIQVFDSFKKTYPRRLAILAELDTGSILTVTMSSDEYSYSADFSAGQMTNNQYSVLSFGQEARGRWWRFMFSLNSSTKVHDVIIGLDAQFEIEQGEPVINE